jgi:hypothetical protein
MDQVSGSAARPKTGKVLGCIAAALLFAAAIGLPQAANAAHGGGGGGGGHGGGGGFHGGGGGFHGGGGGFHGGGFHGGGFHAGGFHGGGFHAGGFHDGFHGGGFHRGFGVGFGLGGLYAPYADTYDYPDYGYYQQPYATQYWYYCSNPAGYYPYVTQCNTGWQTVPAS